MMRRVDADLLANMRCVVYKSMVAPLFEYCASISDDDYISEPKYN